MGAADGTGTPSRSPSAASSFLPEAGKDPSTSLAPLTAGLQFQMISEAFVWTPIIWIITKGSGEGSDQSRGLSHLFGCLHMTGSAEGHGFFSFLPNLG